MSITATTLRNRRRASALPGCARDRWLQFCAQALPAAVGAILATMVITPLYPRSEVSFLLDRNKVAITEDRMEMADARYRGEDDEGRPFTVTAGQAVQHSAKVQVVQMHDIYAQLQLADGEAQVRANNGHYDLKQDQIIVNEPSQLSDTKGYHMQTNAMTLDLRTRKAYGSKGVTGQMPTGTFTSDNITTDIATHDVVLTGHARLRMSPAKSKK